MSFNNENENNNENNNNENNNNENNENNNEDNIEVRNIEQLRGLLKEEFNINPKNKKYINKLIRNEVIDEEMIEKLLNGNSRKMKAFYRWMENEVGYKKNPKTKQWFQVENNNLNELLNNNENNNELNNKNFNLNNNGNINLENNLNNVKRGNSKKNNRNKKGKKQNNDIVNKKKLNKVLKVYFGDKEGYKLTEYENLIKISKNIGKNNSENVIKEKLSKLMEERDANNGNNRNNKSINKNGKKNNKEGKLDTKNFVVLNLDNHCILKKANANAKLSNYNINKIPEMCSEEGVKKFFKFLNKMVSNFHFLTLEKNEDFLKTLKENKNKSMVLYLQQFDVYLYYHQKYLYILNYTTYAEIKLHNFLEKFIKKSKIKKIEDILCEVNNNSLSCVCLDYLIFLSLINPKVKFKSINKIIKDIAIEIRDFILYLCQKRVFS